MKGVKYNWNYHACFEHNETTKQYADAVKYQVNRIFIGSIDVIDLRGLNNGDTI
tara:strand:- start:1197 stop:1358 length:162 start_codon:yes stop_codon:yes gene_type:complete